MFAGRNRRSSNIRVMQLFHELKQQFPTVPDQIVTSLICSHAQCNSQDKSGIVEFLENTLAEANLDPMGRPSQQPPCPIISNEITLDPAHARADRSEDVLAKANHQSSTSEQRNTDMTDRATDANRNVIESAESYKTEEHTLKSVAKRPNHLDLHSETDKNFNVTGEDKRNFNIQYSEKCKNIHKFLNVVSDKPPRSPQSAKRFAAKSSPTKAEKNALMPTALPLDSQRRLQDETNKSPDEQQDVPTVETKKEVGTTDIPKEQVQRNIESLGAVKKRPWSAHLVKDLTPRNVSSSESLHQKDEESSGAVKKDLCSTPTQTTETLETSPRRGKELVKETCSTPTQTTDTLIASPNLNLSLNVNLDMLQSPSLPKRTSVLELTPSQPWLQAPTTSPRSFTSVNLTLRSPSSTPQDPIDITSHNSSLTYSTSNFDSQKGLGSRLQITVGPGGAGSVQSVRLRPRSYHPGEIQQCQDVVPIRAGSLNDLAVSTEPPVALKQKARLERLRSELDNEKAKLERARQEVEKSEKKRLMERRVDREVEKQLELEIRHLRSQCKELEFDGDEFYSNIYTGPHGPLLYNLLPSSPRSRQQQSRRRLQYRSPPPMTFPDLEGPKWNCGVCTFLNHPDLDKCEQCEMPRIVHGTRTGEAVNPNVTFSALQTLNNLDRSMSVGQVLRYQNPDQSVEQRGQTVGVSLPHIPTSHSAPNFLSRIMGRREDTSNRSFQVSQFAKGN